MPPFRIPSEIAFECLANFRDLGGHRTRNGRRLRDGLLFRSGHLGHCSETDVARLAALALRSVFDFRTAFDIERDGSDRLPDGVRHVWLPVPEPAGHGIREMLEEADPEQIGRILGNGGGAAMMRRSAAGLVRERRAPFADFLRALLEDDATPALFHCSAGKDRAGWACSVVLLALGVEEEEVIEQYLLSNREAERILERLRGTSMADWNELYRPLLEVRREYIETSLAEMRREWGGLDGYLEHGLGIDSKERERLTEKLLE